MEQEYIWDVPRHIIKDVREFCENETIRIKETKWHIKREAKGYVYETETTLMHFAYTFSDIEKTPSVYFLVLKIEAPTTMHVNFLKEYIKQREFQFSYLNSCYPFDRKAEKNDKRE